MTGPEHYREAEKWLGIAKEWWELGDGEGDQHQPNAIAATAAAAIAQGHAMAATAAAVGLAIRGADAEAWEIAAGPVSVEPTPRPS